MTPAEAAKLKPGDRVRMVKACRLANLDAISQCGEYVRRHRDHPGMIYVLRDGLLHADYWGMDAWEREP